MKRTSRLTIWAILAALSFCSAAFAQEGNITGVTFSSNGRPAAGVNIAVCTSIVTTGAAVANNVATLTFASNPITQGFFTNGTLTVSGFTGADTYFNGSFQVAAVSATTISYALTHANASASSNGAVYEVGTATHACAALAAAFTDNTGNFTSPNPTVSDGLGNYTLWVAPGYYTVQSYGPTVATSTYLTGVACVPSAVSAGCVGTFGGSTNGGNQFIYSPTLNQLASTPNFLWNQGAQTGSFLTTTAATGGANQSSPSLQFIANCWNGSASAQDIFSIQSTPGAGTNTSETLTFTHTAGCTTAGGMDFSSLLAGVKLPGTFICGGSPGICTLLQSGAGSGNALVFPLANPVHANMCQFINGGNPNLMTYADCPFFEGAVNLTAQSAAITGPQVLASPALFNGASQYMVFWDAKVTTAATTGAATSTLGPLTINYVDPDGVTQTITCAAQSKAGAIETSDGGNVTTTVLLGVPFLINSNNGSNTITYTFGYASNTANQMQYNLHIRVAAVN